MNVDFDFDEMQCVGVCFVKIGGECLLIVIDKFECVVGVDVGEIVYEDIVGLFVCNGIDLIVDCIEEEGMVVEVFEFDVVYGQGYFFGMFCLVKDDVIEGDVEVEMGVVVQ